MLVVGRGCPQWGRGDGRETKSLTGLKMGPKLAIYIHEGRWVLKASELQCCHLVEKVLETPQNKDGNRHLLDAGI